jgi:hypothetical protein
MDMISLLGAVATLVFCAPGYPGAAGDAQPFVDQFAKTTVANAGWSPGSLAAIYDPTESGGIAKLKNPDAVLTFVPYAFYVQYSAALHLTVLAQADVANVGTEERWTLVGKQGASAQSLSGYTLISTAGYAPDFIKHAALAALSLPGDLKIESTGQILSALRRVSTGENVVVLLDQTQSAALASLPFAAQLKTLAQSPPLPVALIAVVDNRVPQARAKSLQGALYKLSGTSGGPDSLSALHLKGFVPPKLPAQP